MTTRVCTICGQEGLGTSDRWYLIAESRWEDKLKILEWDDFLASQNGIHQVCSVTHVQELVVHWMTTGSVDYPFAQTRVKTKRLRFWRRPPEPKPIQPMDFDGRPSIGELAVDRESLHRVLRESPHSLKSILDALLSALQRVRPAEKQIEKVEEERLEPVAPQI